MTPTPAMSDAEINDIKFALRSRLVIDSDMSAEDFKQIVRAIEAKVLDRARATAEPVYLYELDMHEGTGLKQSLAHLTPDEFEKSGMKNSKFTARPLYLGATVAPSPAPDKKLQIELELRRDVMSRYPFCPDHRDKVRGLSCRQCEIERLTKLVERAASGASPEPTADQCVAVRRLLDRWERDDDYSLIKFIDDIRAALAVGTEIHQKHSEDSDQ